MPAKRKHAPSGLFVTHGSRVPEGVLQRAQSHRDNPTSAESLLWEAVRAKRAGGYKFRRQQPIGAFIADFYCDALRLVVEVDGPIHEGSVAYDSERDAYFASRGLRVIRFRNEDVLNDLPGVVSKILSTGSQS